MHVAIVTHSVIRGDGQGRVNYELTKGLLERGIDVDLVADEVAPELLEGGASWVPVHPGYDSVDLLKVWQFKRMVDRRLDEIADRYDVILACGVVCSCPHAVNAVHFVHGTWLASPYHASIVGSGIDSWYQWIFTALNARWEKETLARSRKIVAVSDMVRRELIEIGVSKEKIEVIVNGVDLEEFAPGSADRQAIGLPEDEALALFVGDIRSPIKNLDTVLRALSQVPSLHLAVAGTLEGSPYPALAEELGVSDRTYFLGFRDDVPRLMRSADLFVLVSRRDSCPLVMLEAMASGLPIVTARTVGTADIVEPDCGFVLNSPDDLGTLVRSLRILAEDASRREEMGSASREEAERHTWQAMADQYLELFTEARRTRPHVKGSGRSTIEPS